MHGAINLRFKIIIAKPELKHISHVWKYLSWQMMYGEITWIKETSIASTSWR